MKINAKFINSLLIILMAFLLFACASSNVVGQIYYNVPNQPGDSMKIFLDTSDEDKITKLILVSSITTDDMKLSIKNDDLEQAKDALFQKYHDDKNRILDWSEYAIFCDTCDYLVNGERGMFLSVDLSDSINQLYDKRYQGTNIFGYNEILNFDFTSELFLIDNQEVKDILEHYHIYDAYDMELGYMSQAKLKESNEFQFRAFFDQAEIRNLLIDGSIEYKK